MRRWRGNIVLILAAVSLASLLPGAAGLSRAAEPTGVHLRHMLAGTLQLTLNGTTLQEAFTTIARAADISIEVEQSVYHSLPYGGQTRIDVAFHNVTVEKALRTILKRLNLRMSLSGGHVVIRPDQPLARIGRRATWDELILLRRINDTRLTEAGDAWLGNLAGWLKTPQLQITVAPATTAQRNEALAVVRTELPCSIGTALTAYARALHMIWFLRQRRLYIEPAEKWVRRQLDRPIVLSETNAPLESVVAELSALAGVRFQPQPGLYLAVPRVSVDSNDGTIRQTLDALSGATGITYHIVGEAVQLQLAHTGSSYDDGRDPVVATITGPWGPAHEKINVFIRASDLSPAQRQALAEKVRQAVQAMNPVPATSAPATQP